MRTAEQLLASVKELAGSSVRYTGTAGVFTVNPTGLRGWVSGGEDRETALLRLFAGAWPQCAIWLDRNDADILAAIGNRPSQPASTDSVVWRIVDSHTVVELVDELTRGGWGLFFGESGRLSSDAPPELTFEPAKAKAITTRVGAALGVISWYDDTEWLLCITDIK